MVYEIAATGRRASESNGHGTSSHLAQTPSDSNSNHRDTPGLCPVCGEPFTRGQDLKRHILDVHLPDGVCCPHQTCSWRGSRKETLYKHIGASKKCGPKPESMDQYEIYNTELALHGLLIDRASLETVEEYVFGWIEERANELNKVDAWGPLTKWRKRTSQALVENVLVDI